MKNRRGIRHPPSDKAPVSFYDVVDSFSEEEWKLLQLWQKELYSNLMKEIQQAFNSLGPLIATSVFSLKPKVNEDMCSVELQDLDTKDNVNLYSGDTAAESDMMFEENQYLKGSPDEGEHGSVDVPSTGDGLLNPVGMEEGLEPGFMKQYDAERGEHRTQQTIGTADMAAAVSFSIKSEEEMYSDSEKSESINCTTWLEVMAPVASIGINEEGQIYPIDMQDDSRGESSNSHLGKGNMNRKRGISNPFSYNDKPRLCKTSSKKLKGNVVQRVSQKNSVSPVWPGNDGELEEDIKTQSQSGFQKQGDFSLQKTASFVQLPEIYDNCESTMRSDNTIPCEKSTLQSPESDQGYQKDSSTGNHQAHESKSTMASAPPQVDDAFVQVEDPGNTSQDSVSSHESYDWVDTPAEPAKIKTGPPRSLVWDYFQLQRNDTREFAHYVKCLFCGKSLSRGPIQKPGRAVGTKSMIRHLISFHWRDPPSVSKEFRKTYRDVKFNQYKYTRPKTDSEEEEEEDYTEEGPSTSAAASADPPPPPPPPTQLSLTGGESTRRIKLICPGSLLVFSTGTTMAECHQAIVEHRATCTK